ncbi:MAG: EAL domain-containing protein [Gammaproteobacteria bacterium]
MINNADPAEQIAVCRASLPTKITGLVFWGLVIVGLVLAALLLPTLQRQTSERLTMNVERFAYQMELYLAASPEAAPAQIQDRLKLLADMLGIHGVELYVNGHALRAGTVSADDAMTVRILQAGVAATTGRTVRLKLYAPPLDRLLAEQRKQLLMLMGVVFLLFGFVLQRVLHKLLTRPFLGMVQSARQFSEGAVESRFDAARDDEFGYLATFINKALDYVMLQQNELRGMLKRVRESETALAREKERAVVTLHSIGDAVITTDAWGNIEYLNGAAEALTGRMLDEIKGCPIGAVMHLIDEHSRKRVESPVEACLREGVVVGRKDQLALLRPDGSEIAIADSAAPIRDHDGQVLGAILVFNDVGHTRKLARQLSFQASHDALTGLFNRREFEQQLQRTINSECADGQQHALCYLDLDQFKVVNDTCGHIAGDELLRQLAGLLHGEVRESDILARLGGDEFGVMLKGCCLSQALRIAEDLRARVKDFRFVWQGHSFEIGVSIGIAALNATTQSIADVMSVADVACYAAKDLGRNRVHVYQPDDSELKQRRGEMRWVSRLHKAIAEDRFVLYYQPIVQVIRGATDDLHFEVLIRLRDEQGKEVPPMAFIPAAERYNLMPSIDRWVVRNTLRYLRALPSPPAQWLCVMNLSGQTLCDDQFLDYVLDQLQVAEIDPRHLCFEITETAAIANLRHAVHFMTELKAIGCRFALDDFGSGLSSFAYLKNLRVDYLKIDGGFVKDMVDDPIDCAMVEAINQIGHVMGIQTIAEFVESDAILSALGRLGVDYAQGYWVAAPRPLDDLLARGAHGVSQLNAV